MKKLLLIFLSIGLLAGCKDNQQQQQKGNGLNVLLITLDDMGYGVSGMEGCKVPDITPNIDLLASQGFLFTHGYVSTPMCGPSRAAMLSGRYPHCSGVMGHGVQPPPLWEEPLVKTPLLPYYLNDFGYRTGALLKYAQSGIQTWDVKYQEFPYGLGFHDRNPNSFYKRTKAFITQAMEMDQPFFLYANPIDPHDPWADTKDEKQMLSEMNPFHPYPAPDRQYTPDQVEVPACLPDLPDVRKNLVPYYEALHRGDACVGAILKALEESGQADNTIVIFLSDNGMGAPAAKNTVYPHGTRTPLVVKLPNKIKPGGVDQNSIVCAIDIMPTVLEALELPAVKGIEGRSFYEVATLQKEKTDRAYAFTSFDYWGNSVEKHFYPQRAIVNKDYCYIWNSYVQRFKGEKSMPSPWFDVVASSVKESEPLTAWIEFLRNPPVEEFYDLQKDPGCWVNLVKDEKYKEKVQQFRANLQQEMNQTNDPERTYFDNAN